MVTPAFPSTWRRHPAAGWARTARKFAGMLPGLVAFEHDRAAALGGEVHLRDEPFLAELLAMGPNGVARCGHIARISNLSAPFVAGCAGARRRAGAYACRQQRERHTACRYSHCPLDAKSENAGVCGHFNGPLRRVSCSI